MKTGSHAFRDVTVDSRSGVCPHPLTSQPFLAQNLSLARVLPSHGPQASPWCTRLWTIWSLLSSAPSCSLRLLQPTFCPSNVPSKFWPLCTAVSSVLPQASTRLCKPKSKERPPHTTQSKPLALASCRRCLGVLQTPKMVCRFRPQCSFLYHFSSFTLSPSSPFPAEDKLQAEPHPEFLLSLLSLPFSVVTFAADNFTHTLCFCATFLTPQGPQLGVPTLPASQYTTVQERPTGSLQKYYMNGANKHHL